MIQLLKQRGFLMSILCYSEWVISKFVIINSILIKLKGIFKYKNTEL